MKKQEYINAFLTKIFPKLIGMTLDDYIEIYVNENDCRKYLMKFGKLRGKKDLPKNLFGFSLSVSDRIPEGCVRVVSHKYVFKYAKNIIGTYTKPFKFV